MQDDQDNGESPALDTLEIWNGSSTAESATDEPLATRSAAYDFSGDDSADSGAYQPPLDDDARDSRTFQVADHGVALSPVPPAPIRSSRSSRAKHADSAAARTGEVRQVGSRSRRKGDQRRIPGLRAGRAQAETGPAQADSDAHALSAEAEEELNSITY